MRRFYTNQQPILAYVLAEAGLTDKDIRAADPGKPIVLSARDIDVTCHEGLPVIHFCRSHWTVKGAVRRAIEQEADELTYKPLVRLACGLPSIDTRYGCRAELTFDERTEAATLTILEFLKPHSIPNGTNIQFDSCVLVEHDPPGAVTGEDANATTEELVCAT